MGDGMKSHLILLIFPTLCDFSPYSVQNHHEVVKRDIEPYLIGGEIGSMKTAVAIFVDNRPVCSGTILSQDFVVTAVHCVEHLQNVEKLKLVAGEGDLRSYVEGMSLFAVELEVFKIHIHENFEHEFKKKLIWDLALLEVKTRIPIGGQNPNIEAALLPPPRLSHMTGKEVQIGGWGKTRRYSGSSPVHLVNNLKIKSDRECYAAYDLSEYWPSQMFCLGTENSTSCRGDSGSGAIFRGCNKPVILGKISRLYDEDY